MGCEFRFFSPQGGATARREVGEGKSRQVDWGEIIEFLIANGHQYRELADYTARQLLLFYEKALIRYRRARADRTIDVCYGVNSGKEELESYINTLTAD